MWHILLSTVQSLICSYEVNSSGGILIGQPFTTEALEGHFYLLLITYYLLLITYHLLLR